MRAFEISSKGSAKKACVFDFLLRGQSEFGRARTAPPYGGVRVSGARPYVGAEYGPPPWK